MSVQTRLAEAKARRAALREKRRTIKQKLNSTNERIRRLARQAKKPDRKGVPNWLPDQYVTHWREPWTAKARLNDGFRARIWANGYVSPNFTRAEAACKNGTPLPVSMRTDAQEHAFGLEVVRHELGDVSMPVLSWYRTPEYNRQIGGATASRHMKGDATDFTKQTIDRIGRARFIKVAEKVYANDGFGQYPSGSVHLDDRDYKARWNDF